MSGHFGSCGDCRYSAAVEGEALYMCRRYAPHPPVDTTDEVEPGNHVIAYWPVVDVDDWCGEFMAR